MKFKVVWSDFAVGQLDAIYEYYKRNASENVALKIAQSIIISSEKLTSNPEIGQIEELLQNRKQEYRYLVTTNYKIIYSIDKVNHRIKIADVFDTRQNPIKIERS